MNETTQTAKSDLYRIVQALSLETFHTVTRYELAHRTLPNGSSEYVATMVRSFKNCPSTFHSEELFRGHGLSGHTGAQEAIISRHRADCGAWLQDLKTTHRPSKKTVAVAQGSAA